MRAPVNPAFSQARPDPPTHGQAVRANASYARDPSGHFDQPLWLPVDGAGGPEMSLFDPCLTRSRGPSGQVVVRLGMPLVDDYLEFLEGRCRPNTVLAAGYDLRVFFGVVDKPAAEVRPADVLGFITAQRTGRTGCIEEQ